MKKEGLRNRRSYSLHYFNTNYVEGSKLASRVKVRGGQSLEERMRGAGIRKAGCFM